MLPLSILEGGCLQAEARIATAIKKKADEPTPFEKQSFTL